MRYLFLFVLGASLLSFSQKDEKHIWCYGEGTSNGKKTIMFSDIVILPNKVTDEKIKALFLEAVKEKDKNFIPESSNWIKLKSTVTYEEVSEYREGFRDQWRANNENYVYIYFGGKFDYLMFEE